MEGDGFFQKISHWKVRTPTRGRNFTKVISGVAAGGALNHHQEAQKILPQRTENFASDQPEVKIHYGPKPERAQKKLGIAQLAPDRIVGDMPGVNQPD